MPGEDIHLVRIFGSLEAYLGNIAAGVVAKARGIPWRVHELPAGLMSSSVPPSHGLFAVVTLPVGMCGRTSLFVAQDDLEDRFDARVVADGGYRPRFNIGPGEPLEIITNEALEAIDRYTWGLVPYWADDPSDGFIDARSETADEKPTFRDAWDARPCLVLSSGSYEWQAGNGGPKQPYRVYREDDAAFAMAGLWEEWHGDDGEALRTVTILTTEPNDVVEPIHDRMPVVLPRGDEDSWLTADPDE